MNQAIRHFYKYQPIGPNFDLLSFEEILTVDNPSRLIQIAHYDIELTAWINEKELQLSLKERGTGNTMTYASRRTILFKRYMKWSAFYTSCH